ncbi:MAG: prolipoprotein diacylglyceryl transferase [Pseudomonadota bacterium]
MITPDGSLMTLVHAMIAPSAALPFPQIDPVAIEIGPLAIRWYGLAYMTGLLLGWLYVRSLLASPALWAGAAPLDYDDADNLLFWITIGVVVGGRIGFFLFYEPQLLIANPLELFKIWQGGMAFHGGLLGVAIAIYLFAVSRGVSPLTIGDLVAAATPIGLFFGRLANFINAEVVGRVSDVPWAVRFPMPDGTSEPRHPSQLYEAALEGAMLFAVLAYMIFARGALRWPGYVTGIFLIGYGVARTFVELFRDFDPSWYSHFGPFMTSGMVYSVPMIIAGYLILRSARYRGESMMLDRQ